jgi:hypothetical protein
MSLNSVNENDMISPLQKIAPDGSQSPAPTTFAKIKEDFSLALGEHAAVNNDNNINAQEYARQMVELFKSILASCEKPNPNAEIDITSLSCWLKKTCDRASSRIGESNLNFADFLALREKYGNGWAKFIDVTSRWAGQLRGFTYYDGDGDDLIVAESAGPAGARTEAPIADYAEDMIAIMDKDGDGNGTVSQAEFVSHMLRKRI